MNSKQRMIAALEGQTPDHLPVAPIYLHLYLAQQIRRFALDGYRAWIGDRQEMPLEPQQAADIQAQALRLGWEWLGETPDWIWTRLAPSADWLADCVVRHEGGRLWRIHRPSGEREDLCAPVVATDSTADRWELSARRSLAAAESLVPIQPAAVLLANGTMAVAQRLVAMLGERIFVCGTLGSPFWRCYALLGFQGLLTTPLDDPGWMHELLRRQTTALLELARAYQAVGVHGVFIEECLTSADLLSPRLYDEFVFPYDQELLAALKSLGLPSIHYVCGDVLPRLPRILELASTALAVEESKKGWRVDLAEVAAVVRKQATLFGNLDSPRIRDWEESELQQQLENQVQAARLARGFVVSMGSPFTLDTPRERVARFIALTRELGA